MGRMQGVGRVVALTAVVIAAGGASAVAGKPATERIDVDATFPDSFLSDACGVPVTTAALGHITVRTYDGGKKVELVTLNIGLTATGPGGTIRFRDVGSDMVRRDDNGDLILSIRGQVPFRFTGLLRLNETTGEVLQEPRHSTADELEDACERLT